MKPPSQPNFSILPLHGITPDKTCRCGRERCDSKGKHPITKNGSKDASALSSQISQWEVAHPGCNWGIATGKINSIVVVDVDQRNGGLNTLDELEQKHGKLPATPTVKTGGGGLHYYFKYPNESLTNRANFVPGIDFKTDGGYVVAPQSKHASGEIYEWMFEHSIDNVALAEMPAWLVEYVSKRNSSSPTTPSESIPEGTRNSKLFELAIKLRRADLTGDEIYEQLKIHNTKNCQPPLEDDEVKRISESAARYNEDSPKYGVKNGSIVHFEQTKHGTQSKTLCNFTAKIIREEIQDDGVNRFTHFVIAVKTKNGKPLPLATVVTSKYESMNWVTDSFGAAARIEPGPSKKDHLRYAILELSGQDIPQSVSYAHYGWRIIDEHPVFLNAGSTISSSGSISGIEVATGHSRLNKISLPGPGTGDAVEAIRKSLSLTKLGPANVIYVLLAAVYRAPLAELVNVDHSVFIVGPSGTFKSEVAALAQQHFGSQLNSKNLPGNFSASANSLEKMLFMAKDCVVVIDDFAPTNSNSDIATYHKTAERVFRGQGNGSGRGRMASSTELRPEYFPRGLILATGEDIPRGHSCRARIMIVEMSPGDISRKELTIAQREATDGHYAQAMSEYIHWLAKNFDSLKVSLPVQKREFREKFEKFKLGHNRTPDISASLMLGFSTFLKFCLDVKAINTDEYQENFDAAFKAIQNVALRQEFHSHGEDPKTRFVELLGTVFQAGKGFVQFVDGRTGDKDKLLGLGWTKIGSDGYQHGQTQIGYYDDESQELLLSPGPLWAVISKLASEINSPIPIGQKTMWKRLAESGLTRTDKDRNTYSKAVNGRIQRFICIPNIDEIVGAREEDKDE